MPKGDIEFEHSLWARPAISFGVIELGDIVSTMNAGNWELGLPSEGPIGVALTDGPFGEEFTVLRSGVVTVDKEVGTGTGVPAWRHVPVSATGSVDGTSTITATNALTLIDAGDDADETIIYLM